MNEGCIGIGILTPMPQVRRAGGTAVCQWRRRIDVPTFPHVAECPHRPGERRRGLLSNPDRLFAGATGAHTEHRNFNSSARQDVERCVVLVDKAQGRTSDHTRSLSLRTFGGGAGAAAAFSATPNSKHSMAWATLGAAGGPNGGFPIGRNCLGPGRRNPHAGAVGNLDTENQFAIIVTLGHVSADPGGAIASEACPPPGRWSDGSVYKGESWPLHEDAHLAFPLSAGCVTRSSATGLRERRAVSLGRSPPVQADPAEILAASTPAMRAKGRDAAGRGCRTWCSHFAPTLTDRATFSAMNRPSRACGHRVVSGPASSRMACWIGAARPAGAPARCEG